MRSAVAQQLRQRTASTHARVEEALDLLDPGLSHDRVRDVLMRFAGFWRATERVLDEWAERETTLAEQLRWPRRRRSRVLRADLVHLGLTVPEVDALPEAGSVFTDPEAAEVLGWLYVSEGSTLGGAVIDRTLRALPAGAQLRLRTFTPYPEGPGPMWREYLEVLAGWVGDDAQRRERVVTAAQEAFGALEQWLAPLSAESAA